MYYSFERHSFSVQPVSMYLYIYSPSALSIRESREQKVNAYKYIALQDWREVIDTRECKQNNRDDRGHACFSPTFLL